MEFGAARPWKVAGAALGLALWLQGCGGSGASQPPGTGWPQAMTQLQLVLSSDSNDQLSAFDLELQDITLTSAGGRTVSLLQNSVGGEFIHVNALIEPVLSVAVPQDVYVSATATIGRAEFTCVAIGASGSLTDSIYAYGYTPTANVSVTLPRPIAVAGESMGLLFRLLTSKSAQYSSCLDSAFAVSTFSITPTFSLTPFPVPAPQAGGAADRVYGLDGEITAVNGVPGSFQLTLPAYLFVPARSLMLVTDGATTLQGLAAGASLGVGSFVDLDGSIQPDGSIHATRVAVADPTAVNARRGPIFSVYGSQSVFTMLPRQAQGSNGPVATENYEFGSAQFAVSGQFSNIGQLPFTATFSAANMVAGQTVYVTAPSFILSGGLPYYAAATTITLMPQTLDGAVVGIGASGAFTVYTVQLAAADPFPTLSVQPGQTTLLSQPDHVQVYVDAGTRLQNSMPVSLGNPYRFYGLVFDDAGILRMDCAQIDDGVAP